MNFRSAFLGFYVLMTSFLPSFGQATSDQQPSSLVGAVDDRSVVISKSFPRDQNNPSYWLRLREEMKPAWQKNLLDFGLKHYQPTFTDDRIFLVDEKRVLVLSTEDGSKVFDQTFDHTVRTICPVGNLLFLQTGRMGLMGGKSWLIGYDLKAGKMIWEQELGKDLDTPLQSDGDSIFVFDQGAWFLRLRAFGLDGKERWAVKSKGGPSSPMLFREDRIIYEPIGLHKVVALDRKSGQEVWEFEKGWGWSDVSMRGKELLVASRWVDALNISGGVKLIALAADTGREHWFHRLPADDSLFSRELVYGFTSNDQVGILQTSRTATAYTLEDGRVVWSTKPDKGFDFVERQKLIVLGDHVLVFQANKKKALIDMLSLSDGKRTLRASFEDELISGVHVLGNRLFMTFRHGTMVALPLEAMDAQPASAGVLGKM